MNARLYAAGLTYSGMGWVISRGRDFSRNLFKITDATSEKIQGIHDSIYMVLIAAPISLGLYATAAFNLISGPLIGYSIDAYRDLTGLDACCRACRRIYRNHGTYLSTYSK